MNNRIHQKWVAWLVMFGMLLSFFTPISLAAEEDAKPTQTMEVSPSTLNLQVGGSQPLFSSIWEEASSWSTSDENVVTVNETSGVVNAVNEGTATVTATLTRDPDVKGHAEVTVVPAHTEAVSVSLRVEAPKTTVIEPTTITLKDNKATDTKGNTQDYGRKTPYAALTTALNENSIPYIGDAVAGPYVSSIDGVEASKFGGYDGWQYTIIRNEEIDPTTAIIGSGAYDLQTNDELIFYYADGGTTPVAALNVDQSSVKSGEPIKTSVIDLRSNEPIEGSTVHFGDYKTITNEKGEASFSPQKSGSISIYADQVNEDGLPLIVRSAKQVVTVTEDNSQSTNIDKSIDKLLTYYRSQGVPTDDWAVLGLNALGEDVNRGAYVTDTDSFAQQLTKRDVTTVGDIAKTILSIQSLGYDPTSFADQNWVERLETHKGSPLIHQVFYGLIALDSVEATGSTNVQIWIDQILTSNRAGDAWGFSGSVDVDTTAMALIALAPHEKDAKVKDAIDNGVKSLQEVQQEDGGFGNSSSTEQVVQAITTLGIDPQGEAFTTDNGENPVTNLLTYQLEDGSFKLLEDDKNGNPMSTDQAAVALASVKQFEAKKQSTIFTDIQYAGGTPPVIDTDPSPDPLDKPFTVNGSLLKEEKSGIMATVTVSPSESKSYNEPTYIVFQLMKGNQPVSIVALKETITNTKEATSFFAVSKDEDYQVKVFILDQLTNADNIGETLAKPIVLK